MLETALLVVSLILQALATYLGVKLSVDPLETVEQRKRYKVIFIVILAVGFPITIAQQWLNSRSQVDLRGDLQNVRNDVAKVGEQTKQPPSVTVNVPPIQVVAPPALGSPLPTYRLTDYDYPRGINDSQWYTLTGQRVRIDWREMDGIEVFAELYVWPRDCGGAKVRIFDETTNSVSVEGPLVSSWSDKTPFNIYDCKPVFQRLNLPRGRGTHRYYLQAFSLKMATATAIGEIVLERQQR